MHSGNNREEKDRAQKLFLHNPYPAHRVHLQQNHKKHCRDLGERVGFSEDAGAKVAKASNGVKNRADNENRYVAAEDNDRKLPWNTMKYREHKKNGAQQKFVSNRIEVLA